MHREEVSNLTMNNLVQTVKATGRIGVVGVFVPEDPNAEDKLEEAGPDGVRFRRLLDEGPEHMGTSQANVKAYNRLLSRLIEKDKVKPSWIVSHELPLAQAPEAYVNFDQRKDGWTKVVLQARGLTARGAAPSAQPRSVLLKKATVRCQARAAAPASKRGVVSLLKPCCVPG